MKTLTLLTALFLVGACSTQGTTEPPQFETPEAKECAAACKDAYNGEMKSCGGFQSGDGLVESRRRECVVNAESMLERCYKSCE
jgi:hypothetical protein